MELEFDKEIDAILRKARHTGSAASSPHLDADVIAAFAENALPQHARSQYTIHLADCDRCRKHLSETISISERAAEKAAISHVPAAAAAEASIPWYQAIFRTPNLAVAMGSLILIFTGVLGFFVIRNDRGEQNAIITQVGEPESRQGGPFVDDQAPPMSNANIAMPDSFALTSNTAANMAIGTAGNSAVNTSTASGSGMRKDLAGERPAASEEKNVTPGQMTELHKSAGAPPPPPAADSVETAVTARDESKIEDAERRQAERSDASLALKRKEADVTRSRDLPPAAAKPGPGRSGPVQMQSNQNARNAVQMSVTRSAGGRKFTNRDGTWYDTAYRGQATTNVRRGTDEFRKLDSGLRRIADQIDGVIVVVWKSRAYRIQ